jgi:hypothetical protein
MMAASQAVGTEDDWNEKFIMTTLQQLGWVGDV